MMERNVRDLGSRSPRRKLRGLWRSNPQLFLAIIEDLETRGLVPKGPGGGADG
jgi:hypothetical protein